MNLHTFADLLSAARRQTEPQRLLLVFADAQCPADATTEERAAFDRGDGGALVPKVCVDKLAQDIVDFDVLKAEAAATGFDWRIMFVAALSGRGGHAPNSDQAVQPLQMMVEAIKGGRIAQFLAVNREGDLVQLQAS